MNVVDAILERESAPHCLPLRIHELPMLLRSNDVAVVDAMRRVYGHYVEALRETG
jgi:hypothetical protein